MTSQLDALHAAAHAALPLLSQAFHQQIPPEEAIPLFEPVRAQAPDLSIRLTGEFERASSRYSYDLLLRLPGQATLCLSCGGDEALPWSMRGSQYWQENHMVQVNDSVLTIDQALTEMDAQLRDAAVTDRFVNSCIARDEIALQGITPSNAQVQETLDAMRRTYGLISAQATHAWLVRRGMRHFDLERIARSYAAVRELKRRIAHDRVEAHFEANRSKYRQADVLSLMFATESDAASAVRDLESGRMAAARLLDAIAATTTPRSQETAGVLRTLTANDASAQAIFASHRRVALTRQEDGRCLVDHVLRMREATLDSSTRAAIVDELFDAWLAERRSRASITWYWGDPARIRGA